MGRNVENIIYTSDTGKKYKARITEINKNEDSIYFGCYNIIVTEALLVSRIGTEAWIPLYEEMPVYYVPAEQLSREGIESCTTK